MLWTVLGFGPERPSVPLFMLISMLNVTCLILDDMQMNILYFINYVLIFLAIFHLGQMILVFHL